MIEFNEQSAEMNMTCDHCGEEDLVVDDDWHGCIQQLKERGWRMAKSDVTQAWFHYCVKCRDEV